MKKSIALGLAAGLLASTTLAFAQDVKVDAGVDVEAGVEAGTGANTTAGVTTGADLAASGEVTYGSLIASVSSDTSVDLSAITDESMVIIVLVTSLQGDAEANAEALERTLADRADALVTLRASVEANAVIKAKLEAGGFGVEDVIAVAAQADGSVIVYVDDRA